MLWMLIVQLLYVAPPGGGAGTPKAGSSLRFILFLRLIRGCERDSGGLFNCVPAVLIERDAQQLRAVSRGAGEHGLFHFARAPLEKL